MTKKEELKSLEELLAETHDDLVTKDDLVSDWFIFQSKSEEQVKRDYQQLTCLFESINWEQLDKYEEMLKKEQNSISNFQATIQDPNYIDQMIKLNIAHYLVQIFRYSTPIYNHNNNCYMVKEFIELRKLEEEQENNQSQYFMYDSRALYKIYHQKEFADIVLLDKETLTYDGNDVSWDRPIFFGKTYNVPEKAKQDILKRILK